MNVTAGCNAAPSSCRVVVLGGGTGIAGLLEGLKSALFPSDGGDPRDTDRQRLTAVVTVADDGGSSGRLRDEYGVIAPGDIRKCLLAASDGDPTLAALFGFRFNGRGDLAGHSLGNLMLIALAQLEGQFPKAVDRAAALLGTRGRILPSTPDDVRLVAEFADRTSIEGESRIASVRRPIRRVRLSPQGVRALPQAVEAITAADVVVIGPGSLYTSLIPVLLVQELSEAVARSGARVVVVMNLMTEPGETDGYTGLDHLLALHRHAPDVPIHDVLLSASPISQAMIQRYAVQDAHPVCVQAEALRALGYRPVELDLLTAGPKVRHDPHRLAKAVMQLASPRTCTRLARTSEGAVPRSRAQV